MAEIKMIGFCGTAFTKYSANALIYVLFEATRPDKNRLNANEDCIKEDRTSAGSGTPQAPPLRLHQMVQLLQQFLVDFTHRIYKV